MGYQIELLKIHGWFAKFKAASEFQVFCYAVIVHKIVRNIVNKKLHGHYLVLGEPWEIYSTGSAG